MAQRRVQFVLCYGHPEVPGRLDESRYPVVVLGVDALVPVSVPDDCRRAASCARATARRSTCSRTAMRPGLGRILRSRLRDVFDDASAGRARQAVATVFTAHNAFLLKTMALAGRGVAWLPETLVEAELASRALVPAGGDRWRVPVEIRLYRQNAQMAPTAEELWRVVVGEAEGAP
jgi:DNA-binding transcriptional LysR family regulator